MLGSLLGAAVGWEEMLGVWGWWASATSLLGH